MHFRFDKLKVSIIVYLNRRIRLSDINVFIAFGAGFLSFISPCVFPLYPAFLSYITGMTVDEMTAKDKGVNWKSIIHTIFFLIGFSSIFLVLGFSTSFFAEFLQSNKDLIRQLGAIVIVFFGLVIVGVLNFEFLMKDRSIQFKNKPAGYLGSLLIGLAFSLGWTPCMGPILVIVLSLAASHPEVGLIMMISYTLGFAIPFLVLSFFVGKLDWFRRHSKRITQIGGYAMILVGIALFFDWMTKVTAFLASLFNFTGF